MSVRIWIGENIVHRHEQDQVKKVIELLRKRYEKSKCWCHVLCSFKMRVKNVQREVDMAVIRPGVIFLIELKSVGGSVSGNDNDEWWYRDKKGEKAIVKGGSCCKNPFKQIKTNRWALSAILSASQRIFPGVVDEQARRLECAKLIKGVVVLEPDLPSGESDSIDINPREVIWFYNCRISQVVNESIYRVQPQSEGDITEDFALWLIKDKLKLKEASLSSGIPYLPDEDNESEIQEGSQNGENHNASDDKEIEGKEGDPTGETHKSLCLTETTAKEQASTIDNLESKRFRKKRMSRPSQIRIDMVRAFLSYMGGGFRSVRMVEAGFKFETGHHLCDFIGVPALESLERMAEGCHFEWRWIDSKPAELQVRSTNVHVGCVDLKLVKEVLEFVGSATPEDVDFKALSERIGKDRWAVLMAYLMSMGRRKES